MPGRNAPSCAHLDLYKRNHWSWFSRLSSAASSTSILLLLSSLCLSTHPPRSLLLLLGFWHHHHYLLPLCFQIFILSRSPQAYNIGVLYPYLHLYLGFLLCTLQRCLSVYVFLDNFYCELTFHSRKRFLV